MYMHIDISIYMHMFICIVVFIDAYAQMYTAHSEMCICISKCIYIYKEVERYCTYSLQSTFFGM